MFSFPLEAAVAGHADPYQRSCWPPCLNRYGSPVKEVTEKQAKSARQQLNVAFNRALEAKTKDDSIRLIQYALTLSASMKNVYFRDSHGSLRRNFPKTTKRGSR